MSSNKPSKRSRSGIRVSVGKAREKKGRNQRKFDLAGESLYYKLLVEKKPHEDITEMLSRLGKAEEIILESNLKSLSLEEANQRALEGFAYLQKAIGGKVKIKKPFIYLEGGIKRSYTVIYNSVIQEFTIEPKDVKMGELAKRYKKLM